MVVLFKQQTQSVHRTKFSDWFDEEDEFSKHLTEMMRSNSERNTSSSTPTVDSETSNGHDKAKVVHSDWPIPTNINGMVEQSCQIHFVGDNDKTNIAKKRHIEKVQSVTSDQDRVSSKYNSTSAASCSEFCPSSSVDPFSIQEHRDFVHAIFTLGLKESSPLCVMDQMSEQSKTMYEGLNLERLKSKLQKYRKKKDHHTFEFMASYDESLAAFCKELPNDLNSKQQTIDNKLLPSADNLGFGEVAAYLSFSVLAQEYLGDDDNLNEYHSDDFSKYSGSTNKKQRTQRLKGSSSNKRNNDIKSFPISQGQVNPNTASEELNFNSFEYDGHYGHKLVLPVLTEAEKESPIGRAFVSLITLFKCMEEQLEIERRDIQTSHNGSLDINNYSEDRFTYHLRKQGNMNRASPNIFRTSIHGSIGSNHSKPQSSSSNGMYSVTCSSLPLSLQQMVADTNNRNAILELMRRQDQKQQQQQQQNMTIDMGSMPPLRQDNRNQSSSSYYQQPQYLNTNNSSVYDHFFHKYINNS